MTPTEGDCAVQQQQARRRDALTFKSDTSTTNLPGPLLFGSPFETRFCYAEVKSHLRLRASGEEKRGGHTMFRQNDS